MRRLADLHRQWDKYLPQGSLRLRMVGGTATMLSGTLVAQFSTFVALLIAARMLGSSAYGEYGMVQSTVGLFVLFAGAGMGLTNRRYVANLRDTDPIRCGRVIGFSSAITGLTAGLFAIMLFAFAPLIATQFLNAPGLTQLLRIAAFILFFNGLNENQVGAISGLEKFQTVATINYWRAAITPFLLIGGVLLWQLPGMVSGMALTALFIWLLTGRMLKSSLRAVGISVSYHGIWQEIDIFWRFALPAVASGLLPAFVFFAARAIIAQFPGGYAQLGIYTAAEQWLVVLALVPGQLVNVSQPILSNVYATRDKAQFRRAAIANIALPVSVAGVMALAISIASGLISGLYGATFVGLSHVIVMMCIAGVMRVLNSSVGVLLVTINQMWVSFWINTIWAVIFLLVVIVTTSSGSSGALSLGYANVIAYSIQVMLALAVFYRYEASTWRHSVQKQSVHIDG